MKWFWLGFFFFKADKKQKPQTSTPSLPLHKNTCISVQQKNTSLPGAVNIF